MPIDLASANDASNRAVATFSTTIRHLVEIDPVPDQTAYFLRHNAPDAQRWLMHRLGNYQSVHFTMPGVIGLHQTSLAVEFQVNVPPAERKAMMERQFAGTRSLRALRVTGRPCDPDFLRIYQPDIFIDDGRSTPPGFFAGRFSIGDRIHAWNFKSEAVRDLFEERHVSFLSRLRQQRQKEDILLNADELMVNDGFYKVERDVANSWIWSGAGRIGTFFLPRIGGRRLRITLYLFGARMPLSPEALGLKVDDIPVHARFYPDENKIEADFDCDSEAPSLLISLHHGQLGSTSDGSRSLGMAVYKVRLEAR